MRRTKRLEPEILAPFLLPEKPPDRAPTPIDFPALFGDDHPVELEVGCGKGAFLVEAAADRPGHNFLGLEIDRGLHYYVASRLARRKLANARIGCADARRFLAERIAPQSLAAIHVYFPDPWWKKRHHKRRVWTPEFADRCVTALKPGGMLHIATDVGEYYEIIRGLLDGLSGLVRRGESERTGSPAAGERLTNFERKAREKGGSVWRAEYERSVGTAADSLDTSARASHN